MTGTRIRRRAAAPLRVTTTGTPAGADLRSLAALLVKLDREPPLRLVEKPQDDQARTAAPGE